MFTARTRARAALALAATILTAGSNIALVSAASSASASPRRSVAWYSIVTPQKNEPDPDVVKVGSTFYLYFSQTGFTTPPISVVTSSNLLSWAGRPSAAMPNAPSWAIDGFTWAPDVHHFGTRWVMYFDALADSSLYFDHKGKGFFGQHAQCLGVATASGPLGPFVPEAKPLVCQFDHHGSIDARLFRDLDGKLWLDWKSDDNAPAPARSHVTSLWAQQLGPDHLSLVGHRYRLMSATEAWQGGLIEAPDMVLAENHYWLFYSGNWFNGSRYAIGLAICKSASGPCAPVGTTPWTFSHLLGPNPGEGSVFQDSAGFFFFYSPWGLRYLPSHARPVAVAHLRFGPFGPYPTPISGAPTGAPGR